MRVQGTLHRRQQPAGSEWQAGLLGIAGCHLARALAGHYRHSAAGGLTGFLDVAGEVAVVAGRDVGGGVWWGAKLDKEEGPGRDGKGEGKSRPGPDISSG